MAYYHNGNTLNLHGINSTAFPSSGGAKLCKLGSTAAPGAITRTITLVNNCSVSNGGMLILQAVSGAAVGSLTSSGSKDLNITGSSGSVSQTASPYFYKGTQIYYDVSTTAASNPKYIVVVELPGEAGTDLAGTTIYKYSQLVCSNGNTYNIGGTSNGVTTGKLTASGNLTYTLNKKDTLVEDARNGTSSSPNSASIGSSYTGSGSWYTSGGSTKSLYSTSGHAVFHFLYRSGSWTSITCNNGSWSGSKKIYHSSSSSYITISSCSYTKSGYSFKGSKGAVKYTLKWYVNAYSYR